MSQPASTSLSRLLEIWRHEPTIAANIMQWQTTPAKSASLVNFPLDIHPTLETALRDSGIPALYTHQMQAWRELRAGKNIVVVTETASGKTLCYNLPVLDSALNAPGTRALYLFPTKALTYDQHQGIEKLIRACDRLTLISAAVYDGDTPVHHRSAIRSRTNIVMTNPDMLHTGILPHHTNWAEFFRDLRYVVIDEIHVYRGVFGSHVANLIRRLKRVLQFYGANPQFILTSATISNPGEHASRLIDAPVSIVDQDGSPHGPRHFLLYNPPISQPDLGLRVSATQESVRLAGDLLDYHVQMILFGRARRSVEIMLQNLKHTHGRHSDGLHAYRSGYLPQERRAIEHGLRQGEVKAVVATSALELGIDIGGMDAVLLIGYPGSIAATRQQAGRAGRRLDDALAVMVASANPIDQFLMRHPDYLFGRSPEKALINPDNPLILLQHLKCAAFELAFRAGEHFGSLDAATLEEYLIFLVENGELHAAGDRFFWMADAYPAGQISLRSAAAQPVALHVSQNERSQTIGVVDQPSACWMVHPQAIYLHEGQSYQVESLDLENAVARLIPVDVDYYTEPQKDTSVEKISITEEMDIAGTRKSWGDLLVTNQVTGFRRVRWFTHENLGVSPLEMPPTQLRTTGFWLTIAPETVETLKNLNLWKSEPNDYGPNWIVQRNRARERDLFLCQVCGAVEAGKSHHVHHKIPFRTFTSFMAANQLDNLVTLCPTCHRRVETAVRMRSGLAGLSYVLNNLAPLFLMCDPTDLGDYADPESPLTDGQPTIVIYDKAPAGIGLSESLYRICDVVLARALELVETCTCPDGCPSCIGPAGENGAGGKIDTLALLALLNGKIPQENNAHGIIIR